MEKTYYLIVDGEKIVVTEEVYKAYMQPVWREKRNKRNRWRCRGGKGVRCKGDCSKCELARLGFGARGNDLSLEDLVEQEAPCLPVERDIAEEVILREKIKELRTAISELDKDDRNIVDLLLLGIKDKDCAKQLGISSALFSYRKKCVLKKLRKKLQGFF